MKWWERRKKEPPAPVVQVRQGAGHPFGLLDRYTPLQPGEVQLYRAIREGVPIVDAAIWKLVRLCGGVRVRCRDETAQEELDRFCALDEDCQKLMRGAFHRLGLTARSYDRILRVARTIADLDESENIQTHHLAEAIQYRETEYFSV